MSDRSRASRREPPKPLTVVGLDGYKDGWVAVVLESGRIRCVRLFERFSETVLANANARIFAVDIPVGLPEGSQPRPAGTRWTATDLLKEVLGRFP